MNSSRWSSARWRLDEQEPVEAGGGRRWMNSSSWRLEGVDGGDEQYPMESHFAVRHTPPDEQDPRFDRRRSVSSVLRYATPLPINRTPRFDRRRSVSSVLRYARPLPINRIPFRTWPVEHKAISSVLRYARPRFHRLFRPSPPDEHDHAFRSDPTGWLPRVPLPPDEHDTFRCLPMNTTMMQLLRSDPAMYTSPGRMYAR